MMDWIESHRLLSLASATICCAVAGFALIRGSRQLFRGLRQPEHPDQSAWVVRGIRWGIVAIGLLFIAGGFAWGRGWPFLFGAVFLGEELFETGIMSLALYDQRREDRRRQGPPRATFR